MGRYVRDEEKIVLNNLVDTIFFDEVVRLGSAFPHTLHTPRLARTHSAHST